MCIGAENGASIENKTYTFGMASCATRRFFAARRGSPQQTVRFEIAEPWTRTRDAGMNNKWTLVGHVSEGGRRRAIELRTMPFSVGRRSDLPLCLGRQTVSSCHAEFFIDGNALYLRDLNSRNGTYVNGERLVAPVEVRHEDLIQFADMPFRLSQHSAEADSRTINEDMCDLALGLVQFEKLFTERAIVPFFQPVIDLTTLETIGYEILSRSQLVGLETPAAMFNAAAQLNQEVELSLVMRSEGVRASVMFPEPPHVFVNTHPLEISGEAIVESMTPCDRSRPCSRSPSSFTKPR